MMRLLRGWFGTLRVRLFGPGEPIPAEAPQPLLRCIHRSYTACTYQMGPKGKPAWLCQCTYCGAWFAC